MERDPYWLSNIRAQKGAFITMKSAEEVVVRLNRDSILRINSNNYDLNPDMFEVKVSNGSGLYQTKSLYKSENCQDLLLNIENHKDVKKPLEATFFASRYMPIHQLVFYPNKFDLNSPGSRLMQVGMYLK